MRQFESLLDLAEHFGSAVTEVALELHETAIKIGEAVKKTAQDEIGHYQPAVGPFPAWAPLAPATQLSRSLLGYTPDDPLERSGALKGAIDFDAEGPVVMIGVPERGEVEPDGVLVSDVAVDMELGKPGVPPRPFMGPAGFKNLTLIQKLAGAAVVAGVVGRHQLPPGLGYDAVTTD